jgi:GH15 family glucan-1,4-alpha-glucosidase
MGADCQPPIADYGLIGDGRSAALVSKAGSIDWCCMPRMDHGSCFGRLLDWERAGFCALAPARADPERTRRRYLDGALVLETSFASEDGELRVLDCFARVPGEEPPRSQLLRIVECTAGSVALEGRIAPRFDYGELAPWIRSHDGAFSATGGDDALLISGDLPLEAGKHELCVSVELREGERRRLSIEHLDPVALEESPTAREDGDGLDRRLEQTIAWWHEWSSRARIDEAAATRGVARSALVLKALANPRTGAIAAAPTTSLPEAGGGDLNWDYRFSWVRDSTFTVDTLAEIGFDEEAEAFRRFVERSSAGSAEGVQVLFGLGGERRMPEVELDLAGYRGACPVRVGNDAAGQCQLGVYGQLLELAWRWHERGHRPDDDYWRFLADVADAAACEWKEPDRGIWEVRGDPRQFVHSKAMCWVALDRAIRLAEDTNRATPDAWGDARDEIRRTIESDGYDSARKTFVQVLGENQLDGALLLLPIVGFVAWDDERMVGTVDAVREELEVDGLLLRYRVDDDAEHEGAFLACSFWLVECLAHQGRHDEAIAVFDRAARCANDLGLFAEEAEPETGALLGNFPQGLTHLAHISAALALAGAKSPTTASLHTSWVGKDAVIRSTR